MPEPAVIRKPKAKVAIPVGLENIYVALIDNPDEETLTYKAPEFLARSMKVTLEFILAEGNVPSEDEIEIEDSEIVGINVNVGVSQMDDYIRAMLLGHKIDKDGGVSVNKNDAPKEVALLFQVPLSDHVNSKYVTLYKGKFKPNNEEYESAVPGEKKYKTESDLVGIFRPRRDGQIKYSLRTDSPKTKENPTAQEKIKNWFTAVQEKATDETVLAG